MASRCSIDSAKHCEGNGKQSLKDKNRLFEIARGSALECASIHDVLCVCDAIDYESNLRGKSDLKRIVSMLTRLIQRTETVSEDPIEYEYEYRCAEYEYEEKPNSEILTNKGMQAERAKTRFRNGCSIAPAR